MHFLKKVANALNLDFGQMGYKSKYQREALELVPEGKGKALDLGCGSGHQSKWLEDKGYKLTQLDMIGEGGENIEGHPILQVKVGEFVCANIENGLPFPDDHFDIIWSSDFVEHIRKYQFLFHEMNRIIKPTGIIVITTPNRKFYIRRILDAFGLLDDIQSQEHFHIFTGEEISELGYIPFNAGMFSPILIGCKV